MGRRVLGRVENLVNQSSQSVPLKSSRRSCEAYLYLPRFNRDGYCSGGRLALRVAKSNGGILAFVHYDHAYLASGPL